MIKPDAIPVRLLAGHASLAPEDAKALFGSGYRFRGSERIRIPTRSSRDLSIPVSLGKTTTLLTDRLDRADLDLPLSIVGPEGTLSLPAIETLTRRLLLPPGLIKSWGLRMGESVSIQLGTLILTDVVVSEGDPAGVLLDRADVAAAGVAVDHPAILRRDVPASPPPDAARSAPVRRLITENDVRQARLRGERIEVHPGQIVTPAARSLGRELGVLV